MPIYLFDRYRWAIMGVANGPAEISDDPSLEGGCQSAEIYVDSASDAGDSDNIFQDSYLERYRKSIEELAENITTKEEINSNLVQGFTEEFKKVMKEVREESKINYSLFDEQDEIEKALTVRKPLQNTRKQLVPPDQQITLDENSSPGSDSSRESKTWQLLEATRDERFEITPPVYNAFRRAQRPNIHWKTIDKSKIKCETWLNEYAGYLHTV